MHGFILSFIAHCIFQFLYYAKKTLFNRLEDNNE